MVAFITGMIVGVPLSLVSIKLLSGVDDINQQLIILDTKVERLIDKTPSTSGTVRLPFEGRN